MTVLQTVVEGAEPSRATSLNPKHQNPNPNRHRQHHHDSREQLAFEVFPLPRGVTSSIPVSDTVGPGAKPGEAANLLILWRIFSRDRRHEVGQIEHHAVYVFILNVIAAHVQAKHSCSCGSAASPS